MIEFSSTASLDPARKAELASLLAACAAVDGKAELPMEKSLNFDKTMKTWFFAVENGELAGVLSVFAPRREEAEISAFVHPARRRTGRFAALLKEAERELARSGFADELLVCDRGTVPDSEPGAAPGAAAALAYGATLDFTEYGMTYAASATAAGHPGAPRPAPAGITFDRVGPERLDELVELRIDAFDDSREDAVSMQRAAFASPARKEHVALLEGRIVGACSLAFEENEVSLNGLGVATAQRGKGIARALIGWTLDRLAGSGRRIVLDVESTNAGAYGLYRSMGFSVTRAVDYYRRPFPRAG